MSFGIHNPATQPTHPARRFLNDPRAIVKRIVQKTPREGAQGASQFLARRRRGNWLATDGSQPERLKGNRPGPASAASADLARPLAERRHAGEQRGARRWTLAAAPEAAEVEALHRRWNRHPAEAQERRHQVLRGGQLARRPRPTWDQALLPLGDRLKTPLPCEPLAQ